MYDKSSVHVATNPQHIKCKGQSIPRTIGVCTKLITRQQNLSYLYVRTSPPNLFHWSTAVG